MVRSTAVGKLEGRVAAVERDVLSLRAEVKLQGESYAEKQGRLEAKIEELHKQATALSEKNEKSMDSLRTEVKGLGTLTSGSNIELAEKLGLLVDGFGLQNTKDAPIKLFFQMQELFKWKDQAEAEKQKELQEIGELKSLFKKGFYATLIPLILLIAVVGSISILSYFVELAPKDNKLVEKVIK